jgi:hypothetical protein
MQYCGMEIIENPAGDLDPMVPLSTRVPRSVMGKTRWAAWDSHMHVQDLVREALDDWHARHGY